MPSSAIPSAPVANTSRPFTMNATRLGSRLLSTSSRLVAVPSAPGFFTAACWTQPFETSLVSSPFRRLIR